MSNTLPLGDQTTIGNLKRSDVESTIVGLKPFLKRARWLDPANRYACDAADRLKTAPRNLKEEKDLAQFIAASSCLHVNDGWSYLGRAISSLIAGDSHRALHLGYYAELRAAMSLLASAGIGVFKNKHYVICAANRAQKLNCGEGTHNFAWLALKFWAEQQSSGELFGRIIRPEGKPLEAWFHARGGAAALQAQAKSWFLQWGMDLSRVTKDRDARNASSYRPDGIPNMWDVPTSRTMRLIRCVWEMLEPSPVAPFSVIDLYLLRLAMEGHFKGVYGARASRRNPKFMALAEQIAFSSGLPQPRMKSISEFLTRQDSAADPALFGYARRVPEQGARDVLGILSRAVFLLRMATGSAHELLKSAGVGPDLLSFWQEEIGAVRGLWLMGEPPSLLGDLWADIQVCLEDLAPAEDMEFGLLRSMDENSLGLVGRLNVLTSHERVGLWGLCSA